MTRRDRAYASIDGLSMDASRIDEALASRQSFVSTPAGRPLDSSAAGAALLDAARRDWDVIVVGGGNAALVAAISAAEEGRSVLLLEAAPPHLRAGNTRHTRNIRCAHDHPDRYTPGTYSTEELLSDLRSVGRGPVRPELALLAVSESPQVATWMERHGVAWQSSLRGTLALSRTNRFFLGGGTALANHYYRIASACGVAIHYQARVSDFEFGSRGFNAVVVGNHRLRIRGRAIIAASGGFEANLSLLRERWGPAADNYLVRGTPHNDGAVLAKLLNLGAATSGDPKGFHAVAVDARSPQFDGGIVTRVDCIPFGIVVNHLANRFSDEGRDLWPKRYASWGGLIADQPLQIAYAIVDSSSWGKFIPSVYPPFRADTIHELAIALGLDPVTLERTVATFNAHVQGESEMDLGHLDHITTSGLDPPKSNWAHRLDQPPFLAYPLRVGITFTFMGLAVSERAQVVDTAGNPLPHLFAAGEIMSGNVLTSGYLAGFGMTIGSVFGRIAGLEAARVGS